MSIESIASQLHWGRERGPLCKRESQNESTRRELHDLVGDVSTCADARVTLDANLVGLQVPRTSEAASWEPNVVYEEQKVIQRPPSLQCRHSVRPRPARPMLTAPPCTRRRPACRMSTSRGSGNDFAARPAQQPQHLHGAPIIMRVQHPAQGRRTEVSSMLQHVQ